ncbi:phage terminase large subunit [Methylobacterium sp. NEAU 140]|uniref:phage terminase large subunit n=1 Tax=Methylobacterium sp. NEAU 140 TaxID=3064945 RepID=UPI002736C15B|nr:phage terminase large subunit [Methylobacterium sp. NEAU 140]MDP4026660.1 phage terminase large subunit [Methylobacterium sp. NEAU 140]
MTLRDAYNALLRQRLSVFTRQAYRTVVSEPFLPNWHLEALAHCLEEVARGRIRRLVISIAPRSLKSISASVAFPAWLLGRDPTRQIICLSYAQNLTVKNANDCRAVMDAPWYKDAFPETRISRTKNTEAEFETTRGGFRFSTSVGGVLTGRGGDIIIIDDPLKPQDAMSETARTNVNDWFDRTVHSRLNRQTEGAIILVMQRLHVDDLAGHVLERGGWYHLCLPATAEADEAIPMGRGRVHHRRVGDVLHPALLPRSALDNLQRHVPPFDFAAQYQQAPVPPTGNMFDTARAHRYEGELGAEPGDVIVQSWDTATKPGELNDASVCTTWLARRGAYYLVDVFRARLGYPDLRRAVVDLHARWRPEAVLIEDKASGESLIQDLVSERFWAHAVRPEGDKVMRAHAATWPFETGQVVLPRTAPWLGEFEAELRAFPNGRHDDQVDSVSQFLNWAREGLDRGPRIRDPWNDDDG